MYHSQVNKTETKMLNQNGVVFFLHLLGIDTNGKNKDLIFILKNNNNWIIKYTAV